MYINGLYLLFYLPIYLNKQNMKYQSYFSLETEIDAFEQKIAQVATSYYNLIFKILSISNPSEANKLPKMIFYY